MDSRRTARAGVSTALGELLGVPLHAARSHWRRFSILLVCLAALGLIDPVQARAADLWEADAFTEACSTGATAHCKTHGSADAATGELTATAILVSGNAAPGDQASAVAQVTRTLQEPAASVVRYRLRLDTNVAEGVNTSSYGRADALLSWAIVDAHGIVLAESTGRVPGMLRDAETILTTPPGPGARTVTVRVRMIARATTGSLLGLPAAGIIGATISGRAIAVTAEPA